MSTVHDSYQWFLNNVSIPGATNQTYTASLIGDYKVQVTKNSANTYTDPVTLYNAIEQANSMNYVITHTIQEEGVRTISDIDALNTDGLIEQIQYIDGLGRPMQTVITQGSFLGKDIVSFCKPLF